MTAPVIGVPVIAGLDAGTYAPHPLHGPDRIWPQTNCYTDLWIEALHALRLPPQALLGFTVGQDFEGDQFTFFKPPLEDLEALFGVRVTELAVYDTVEAHVATQAARGRLCLIEVDGFHLPDTLGVGYGAEHGKTTIAVNRIDPAARSLEYFHNDGFFALSGEDYAGVLGLGAPPDAPFLPYAEFAKLPAHPPSEADLRRTARRLFAAHLARRPQANPVRAFQAVLAAQAEALADKPFAAFHKYAFNTLRQLGANFELLAAHLDWLEETPPPAAAHALAIAQAAKTVQFQLARALAKRRFTPLTAALDSAASAWDALFEALAEVGDAPGAPRDGA